MKPSKKLPATVPDSVATELDNRLGENASLDAVRKEAARIKVGKARKTADQALANVNGNPQMISAIKALRDEVRAIEEHLNVKG